MTTHRRPDLLDRAWRIAGAPWVTAALLALTLAVLAVALIFPQQPTELDRVAAEGWLAEATARYGSLGVVLRTVGVFVALDGLILRATAALLAFNLLLRLATGMVQAAQLWRSRPAGERRRMAAFGWPLAWLGLLIALLGLWVNDVAGWRTADVALAPGSSVTPPVASGRGLQLRLDGVSAAGGDATAAVTLVMPDGGTRSVNAGPRWPGRSGNLWLSQRATGPALTVAARDSEGHPLALQTLVAGSEAGSAIQLLFRQNQTEQGFGLPARNLTFRAVSYEALPEKGIGRPVFLVEAYRGDAATPVLSQLVEDEAEVALDDVTLNLSRDRYVLLSVAYLPGLPAVVVGALLALAGAMGTFRSWGASSLRASFAKQSQPCGGLLRRKHRSSQ